MPESVDIPVAPPSGSREDGQPAPPVRPKDKEGKPPPAPKKEDVSMPDLPDNVKTLEVNVSALQHTIGGGGRVAQELQEQSSRAGAARRETEEKKEWEKKVAIKRLGKRIWQQ